jgi:acyl carrier protein
MVPPICIVMDDFPRTPNGKILRASLPPAKQLPGNGDGEYVAPQTPTEERLAAIWSRVLKIARPGRRDTFFEAGGHSLLATQLVSRIREEFQVELPLRAVFEGQTIQLIAAAIDELRSSSKAVEIAAIAPISRVQRSRANRA